MPKATKETVTIVTAFLLDAIGRFISFHTGIDIIFWLCHDVAMAIVFFLLSTKLQGGAKWISIYCACIWLGGIVDEFYIPLSFDYWRYVWAAILAAIFRGAYSLHKRSHAAHNRDNT